MAILEAELFIHEINTFSFVQQCQIFLLFISINILNIHSHRMVPVNPFFKCEKCILLIINYLSYFSYEFIHGCFAYSYFWCLCFCFFWLLFLAYCSVILLRYIFCILIFCLLYMVYLSSPKSQNSQILCGFKVLWSCKVFVQICFLLILF